VLALYRLTIRGVDGFPIIVIERKKKQSNFFLLPLDKTESYMYNRKMRKTMNNENSDYFYDDDDFGADEDDDSRNADGTRGWDRLE
jgi:hypothetical protein